MINYSVLTDEQLVSLCKESEDETAWNELAARYIRVAKAVAAGFQCGIHEREDFVQEGMFGFLSAVYSYKPEHNVAFSTFAGVCIKNRILTALKSDEKKRIIAGTFLVPLEDENETADNAPSPEDSLVSKNEAKRISSLITTILSDRENQVFSLFLSGNSYADIATLTGTSIKAVDGALQRARKKLQKLL